MSRGLLLSLLSLLCLSNGLFLDNGRKIVSHQKTVMYRHSVSNAAIHAVPQVALSAVAYQTDVALPPKSDIFIWRAATLVMMITIGLNMAAINEQIDMIWPLLRSTWWFRHDMFEPIVASSSLFFFGHCWLLVDWLMSSGRASWLQQFHIKTVQSKRETVGKATGTVVLNKWHSGWWWEMGFYLVPIFFISQFTNAFAPRRAALDMAAPTVARVIGEICGGLFVYDFFFWVSHLVMHRGPKALYRLTHGKHHINSDVRAADTVRLAPLEEIADVMCSIFALRVMKAHPISRSLYNVVITFLLMELHSGYDFSWSPQNIVPGNVLAGSRRHHEHHRTGKTYFQKFFTYLDDFFRIGYGSLKVVA